jgi:hypothetical protein
LRAERVTGDIEPDNLSAAIRRPALIPHPHREISQAEVWSDTISPGYGELS